MSSRAVRWHRVTSFYLHEARHPGSSPPDTVRGFSWNDYKSVFFIDMCISYALVILSIWFLWHHYSASISNKKMVPATTMDYDIVDPMASNIIEALRDIGYSLESAIADIIDNSISADARRIDIRFGWESETDPWMAVVDDGHGMRETALVEAMRPGGKDPLGIRKTDDLGRFGLGLKTASFSQCRKLTVVSRCGDETSARQWDLDLVRTENRWILRKLGEAEIAALPGLDLLGTQGTLVLWQALDRLDLGKDQSRFHQVMNERMASICDHIALVFHRFVSGEPGYRKIALCVNNAPVEAYDPFNARHVATMHLGEEVLDIDGKEVTFRPYILPHHSKVTAEEYERLGGQEGYLRGQGFYIYRNRRLIIHGTWFRMARQDEITKLARVQVDIPNTLDYLWTIDVRKSRAHPPEAVKRRLKAILERIRESAKRPYTHRGTPMLAKQHESLWERLYLNGRIQYQPNTRHTLLEEFRSDLPAAMRKRFEGILAVIGKGLPYATLFNDMASRPKDVDRHDESTAVLEELTSLLFGDGAGHDPDELGKLMRQTEPFASAPAFVEKYVLRLAAAGGKK